MVGAECGHLGNDFNELLTGDDIGTNTNLVSCFGDVVDGKGIRLSILFHKDVGLRRGCRTVGGEGDGGDIRAAFNVGIQRRAVIHAANHVGICQQNVRLGGVLQQVQSAAQLIQLADGALGDALVGIGRQNMQAAVLAVQIPFLAVGKVIHQGTVVLLDQYADIVDVGVDHIGQGKVYQTVAAAKGDGCHVAVMGQSAQFFGAVDLGKDNAHHLLFHAACLLYTIALGAMTVPEEMVLWWPTTAMPHSSAGHSSRS